MKLAWCMARYGTEVIGGAEHAARALSERLVSTFAWEVEVFTTTALSAVDWADHYPAGTTVINGVTVHRLAPRAGRTSDYVSLAAEVERDPEAVAMADARRYLDGQGPFCPDVIDAAEASDAPLVGFYPYLFYPTVRGVPRLRERAIVHPAAHDEAALRLAPFGEVFGAARAFAFHTNAERRLVEQLFPVAHKPQVLLGLGVEPHSGDAGAARAAIGLDDRPYVLCVGRIEQGKGAHLLNQFFAAYKRRRPGPLQLVFVGPENDPLPVHPDVVVAGRIDEETKWGLLRGAELLINPSPFESFSLVVLESWLADTPVLVNAACGPTREHAQESGGGLWFDGYATFEVALDRLLADDRLRQVLAARGRAYTESTYHWPALLERYRRFVERVLGTPYAEPAPSDPESDPNEEGR